MSWNGQWEDREGRLSLLHHSPVLLSPVWTSGCLWPRAGVRPLLWFLTCDV